MDDATLVLTIRGRKYTPEFSYKIGDHLIETEGFKQKSKLANEGKTRLF